MAIPHLRTKNAVHRMSRRLPLSGAAFRCLLACWEFARGFGGVETTQAPWACAAADLAAATGLTRGAAGKGFRALLAAGLVVEVEAPRGARPGRYLLEEDPSLWLHPAARLQMEPEPSASEWRHKRLQMEPEARPNGGASASNRSHNNSENPVEVGNLAPPKTEDDKTEKTRSACAREEAIEGPPPGLPPGVVLISGELPAEPGEWTDEAPVVVEIHGERIELDSMYSGLTLEFLAEFKAERQASDPVPSPEPERRPPTLPDLLDTLRAATDRWGERAGNRGPRQARAEEDIARPHMQSRLLAIADRADADGSRAEVLRLARRSADADAAPVRYFLSCFDDDGAPKRQSNKRGRHGRRSYAHYRRS